MSIESEVREAIVSELERQAQNRPEDLKVASRGETRLEIQGVVELEDLVMSIMGSVAGGP
ncbi:hypothetical protein [Jiella sp. M17.18]|uniref:hypothetical protein n=1 Tax=Jiella sp. M17.18 TaxID=3234247 RepID=UPI0034E039D9